MKKTIVINRIIVASADDPGTRTVRLLLEFLTLMKGQKKVIVPTGETFRTAWTETFSQAIIQNPKLISGVSFYHMDEYMNPKDPTRLIHARHPGSFKTYWRKCVEEQLKKHDKRLLAQFNRRRHWPNPDLESPQTFSIAIAGVGREGHLAFNERGTKFNQGTWIAELSRSTQEANNPRGVPFGEMPPTHAVTIGLKEIGTAKILVVAAKGASKKAAVLRAIFGKITKDCPASLAQLMAAQEGKKVMFFVCPEIYSAIYKKAKARRAKAGKS